MYVVLLLKIKKELKKVKNKNIFYFLLYKKIEKLLLNILNKKHKHQPTNK
jgi:hypothetical protein